MTWTDIKAHGSGTLRYMLVIEGWPDVWVTDPSITYSPNGQTVRVGLLARDIVIHDRVIMHEARCEQSPITFKIVGPEWRQQDGSSYTDDATASFTNRPQSVQQATASFDENDASMPAIEGGGSLPSNAVYWVGTEAILVGAWPTITTRGYYSSTAQAHFVATEPQDPPLMIWDAPPTMEGRRAKLMVWGGGNSGASSGDYIWRGFVQRPPQLGRDGLSWQIPCDGVTGVLKQKLAGEIKSAKAVGIYHHSKCSIRFRARYGGDVGESRTTVGWHANEAALFDAINTMMADYISDLGASTFIESLRLGRDSTGNLRLELETGSLSQAAFELELSSPILGGIITGNSIMGHGRVSWIDASDGSVRDGVLSGLQLEVDSTYYAFLSFPHEGLQFVRGMRNMWEQPTPLTAVAPLGYANETMFEIGGLLKPLFLRGERWGTDDDEFQTDNPPWRLYVDQDLSGAEAVAIDGTGKPDGVFEVTATGSTTGRGYWVDIKPWFSAPGLIENVERGHSARPHLGFMGFLGDDTEVRTRRNYGSSDVFHFVAQLKARAITHGNRGDTPFITDDDLSDWDWAEGVPIGSAATALALRDYMFYGPVPLAECLMAELKLILYCMRISGAGYLDVAPLPSLSLTSPVTSTAHVITAADIVTPAGDYGDWPSWEPQRDGRVTTVSYQTEYDARTDEWLDPPIVFSDGLSIALSKTRGKLLSEIKPYSRPTLGAFAAQFMTPDAIEDVAKAYLALFSRDYDVVTIAVPFSKFSIKCLDIVSLTHHHVPDGLGARGLSGRRGVVVERRWPMDPKGAGYGYLTIMLVTGGQVGYAPSAFITDQTNTSGDTWEIECDLADEINLAISSNGDGNCLEHFAVGDLIRVCMVDDPSYTQVTGTITAVDGAAGTATFDLDGAWTPGSDDWTIEFQEGSSTTAQKQYAYVADSNLLLVDDSPARRFQ